MKVEIKRKTFEPIVLTITIEREDERLAIKELGNCSSRVTKEVKEMSPQIDEYILGDVLYEIWEQLK